MARPTVTDINRAAKYCRLTPIESQMRCAVWVHLGTLHFHSVNCLKMDTSRLPIKLTQPSHPRDLMALSELVAARIACRSSTKRCVRVCVCVSFSLTCMASHHYRKQNTQPKNTKIGRHGGGWCADLEWWSWVRVWICVCELHLLLSRNTRAEGRSRLCLV
jgi:hypothetical protein